MRYFSEKNPNQTITANQKSVSSEILCKCFANASFVMEFHVGTVLNNHFYGAPHCPFSPCIPVTIEGHVSQDRECTLAFWVLVSRGKNISLWLAGINKHQNKGLSSVNLEGLITLCNSGAVTPLPFSCRTHRDSLRSALSLRSRFLLRSSTWSHCTLREFPNALLSPKK